MVKIGDGFTSRVGSDSYPYTVVHISAKNRITVLMDDVKRIPNSEDEYEETSRLGVVTTKFRPRLDDTKEGLHDKISGIMHFVMRAYVSVDKQNVKTYKISCGSTADELSGNRLPLKNKLFGNTWKEFIEEIENVKKV